MGFINNKLSLFVLPGCVILFGINGSVSDLDFGQSYKPAVPDSGWVNLIQDEDLSNWIQRGGEAKYHVENGQVVGTTVPDTPNSFLCTKKNYSDFVLELEVKVDPELNSGIQIRSHSKKDFKNGRVHGYQVEIDPSERAWSGGIYDEARRGWLDGVEDQPEARKAFKNGKWNTYRIKAVGDTLRTWVNGIPVANLVDSVDSSGFIALQVHSTDSKEPLQVRWRNIRIKTLN